jgi:hypothetical protein
MPYIPNRQLYLAVMFARRMMREGTPPGIANARAADYYSVSVTDVARHTGQVGAPARRRHRP